MPKSQWSLPLVSLCNRGIVKQPGHVPQKRGTPCPELQPTLLSIGTPYKLLWNPASVLPIPPPIPPALSPPGRGPSVNPNRSQDRQRSGCRRARPLGPRLLATEAAPAVFPAGYRKDPGEARGRGTRADSRDEAHVNPSSPPRPPQLHRSLRCKAKGAFAQGTGRNSARKRKKEIPLVPGAGRQADRSSSPAPPASLTHPLAAAELPPRAKGPQPQPSPGPAPGPPWPRLRARPVVAPPPAYPGAGFRGGLSAGLRDFVPSLVFGHPCGANTELRQPVRTSLAHPL